MTDVARVVVVVVLLSGVCYVADFDSILLKLGVALAVGVGSYLIARDR